MNTDADTTHGDNAWPLLGLSPLLVTDAADAEKLSFFPPSSLSPHPLPLRSAESAELSTILSLKSGVGEDSFAGAFRLQ